MRTLVIIIILVLIVMIAKRMWQKPRPPARRSRKNEQMVQCAHCGIYIPAILPPRGVSATEQNHFFGSLTTIGIAVARLCYSKFPMPPAESLSVTGEYQFATDISLNIECRL